MTISVWRYSHLALAVSSFILLALASVTGIILAFQPLSEKTQPYNAASSGQVRLSEALPVLKSRYSELAQLSVDANNFVQLRAVDDSGNNINAYIAPRTGEILGYPTPKSAFFEWVTALHRSLFLHEAGRFFVGLTAFLLLLITVSGTMLIIQRQRGIKRFFTRIARDHFAQYYHVVLGRLLLIPVFLIALTGTYLSLARFGMVETTYKSPDVELDSIKENPVRRTAEFEVFQKITISEVQTIEFPFSEDVEDYYTLKLKDRELTVNQVTGDILTEVRYPAAAILTEVSMDLHTGRTNAIWAVILALASCNILFFIYSGFTITFKRRAGRTQNRHSAAESEFIILVGSENGSTMVFANAVYRQLVSGGRKAFVCELNSYQVFDHAAHLIVMTATYGLGDPPTNAAQFSALLQRYPQPNPVRFSVVGFGSHSYPDFCKFAFEADNLLGVQPWAVPMLEIHTVNDKSPKEFSQWLTTWAQHADVPLSMSAGLSELRSEPLIKLSVLEKTPATQPGESFLMRMRPKGRHSFTSGDLLAVYPAGDHRERLYSIGKVGKDIQLSVKLHVPGFGSGYLSRLGGSDIIRARIVSNPHFHFPDGAPVVVMISNGTGIAPFLGMISTKTPHIQRHLYCGFRDHASYSLYENAVGDSLRDHKLQSAQIAFSRQGGKEYVSDILARDGQFIAGALGANGVIMLCGSLAMQQNVVGVLDQICHVHLGQTVSYYQSRNQILMDCY